MRDTKAIQADLDAAQDDLEKNVSELKHVIEHKIEVVEAPISFVKKHAVWFAVAAVFAVGLMIGRRVQR